MLLIESSIRLFLQFWENWILGALERAVSAETIWPTVISGSFKASVFFIRDLVESAWVAETGRLKSGLRAWGSFLDNKCSILSSSRSSSKSGFRSVKEGEARKKSLVSFFLVLTVVVDQGGGVGGGEPRWVCQDYVWLWSCQVCFRKRRMVGQYFWTEDLTWGRSCWRYCQHDLLRVRNPRCYWISESRQTLCEVLFWDTLFCITST